MTIKKFLGRQSASAELHASSFAGAETAQLPLIETRASPATIAGLTSIRGLAAWWVVLFHFQFWLPSGTPHSFKRFVVHGNLGVDLFFVLSGYVIALNYAHKLARPDGVSWLRFLWLRIARIYPLHLFVLLLYVALVIATAILSHQGLPPHRFGKAYFLWSLLLMQNWGFTASPDWNMPAWSISVEWLAYILFPAMLWLARKPLRSRVACWLMAFASLALLAAITPYFIHNMPGGDITKHGVVRGLLEFWAGACLFHTRRPELRPAPLQPIIALVLALACVFVFLIFKAPDYSVMPLGFLFFVWALSYPTGVFARLMSGRFIMYLGTLSYSTYMVHMNIRDWGDDLRRGPPSLVLLLFCFMLIFLVSIPLYHFIEMPGRRALRRIDIAESLMRIIRPQTGAA